MPSKREAYLKYAMHYQNVLYQADESYQQSGVTLNQNPSPVDQAECRKWDLDWEQIQHARRKCAEESAQDAAYAMLCSKFAGVAGTLLELKLSRLDQIEWMEAGLAAAELLRQSPQLTPDQRQEMLHDQLAHLTHLGFAHLMNSNPRRAFNLCEKALQLSRSLQNQQGEATALAHLALLHLTENRTDKVIALLEEALPIFEQLGDRRAQGNVLNTFGLAYSHQKQFERAVQCFDQALTIFQETGTRSELGVAFANRANTLLQLGRFDEAQESVDRALEIAREMDDASLEGLALFNQAVLSMQDQNRRSLVIQELEGALAAFRKAGDTLHEIQVLSALQQIYQSVLKNSTQQLSYAQQSQSRRKLGEVVMARQDYEEAVKVYEQLLALAEAEHNLADQLEALIHLGHLNVLLKRYEFAVGYHERVVETLSTKRAKEGADVDKKAECELYLSLGQAYRHLSNPTEAEASYKKGLEIAEAISDQDAARRARGNLGLIYIDLRRFDEAISSLTEVVARFEAKNDYLGRAHTRFNLAYAYHCKGVDEFAKGHSEEASRLEEFAKQFGEEALRLLDQINHPSANEVRRQLATWGTGQAN
jgi:tetratricopeptide (TPR) repeat protein